MSKPEVHPLVDADADALEALTEAFAVLCTVLPAELRELAGADLAAVYLSDTRALALAVTALAESLVERAVSGTEPTSAGGLDERVRSVRQETATLADSHALPSPPRLVRKQNRQAVIVEFAELIRERGLEGCQDVFLGTSQITGAPQIVCFRTTTAAAHVWSMDRLLQRLESFACLDEMLELERIGSAWYFERLSSPGRGGRGGGGRFCPWGTRTGVVFLRSCGDPAGRADCRALPRQPHRARPGRASAHPRLSCILPAYPPPLRTNSTSASFATQT